LAAGHSGAVVAFAVAVVVEAVTDFSGRLAWRLTRAVSVKIRPPRIADDVAHFHFADGRGAKAGRTDHTAVTTIVDVGIDVHTSFQAFNRVCGTFDNTRATIADLYRIACMVAGTAVIVVRIRVHALSVTIGQIRRTAVGRILHGITDGITGRIQHAV